MPVANLLLFILLKTDYFQFVPHHLYIEFLPDIIGSALVLVFASEIAIMKD
jgi:hypothetical protein